ncbi:hypothetical protein [Teredinibacter turnerae]|uniref:hypothetical protein n=1 Tax=Teredinibacter turnerae TaxID=2426 RepID=UPI00041E03EB|nr:hypothetical protein [Teredinibacter turnerae]
MLSSTEMIRGLRHAKRVSGLSVDDGLLDAYIQLIDALKLTLKQESALWKGLQTHLTQTGVFIRDQIKDRLNQTRIYVLPLPVIIAYSDLNAHGQPIIVISNGMVEIIASHIFHAYVTNQLPEELQDFFLLDRRRDMGANELVTNTLFVMQSHHFRHGSALPNFRALLDPGAIAQCSYAINGALSFILLHELGHHELGHITSCSTIEDCGAQFIDEPTSEGKQHEREADQYAFDAIKPEAQIVGTFWQHQALSFFSSLELVAGQALSNDHPLSLNRNYASDLRRSEVENSQVDESRYAATRSRFQASATFQSGKANALLNTPNERCISLIHEIAPLYEQHGIQINKLLNTPPTPWLLVDGYAQ